MISFESIFKALEDNAVAYLVAGGVAVNLHGVERATADLDLVVHLEKQNLEKFIGVMGSLGFKPRVPVDPKELAQPEIRRKWILEKNMKVFSFYNPTNPFEEVDILVQEPLPFSDLDGRKVIRRAFGVAIPILSIEDLIRLKKNAGRPKDLFDIGLLEKIAEKNGEQ